MNTELDRKNIPASIAIIMDGNGRWAKAQGQPRTAGHVQGVEMVKRITEEAARLGVRYLTLYTFSTENWNRPVEEVAALMDLILKNLEEEIFMRNNVAFQVIGQRHRLPAEILRRLEHCEERTKNNDSMTLVIALSYSSRWEITEMVKDVYRQTKAGTLDIAEEDITEDFVSSRLQTAFMSDPDLLIRTGGEQRISNFLMWQISYSELYFCNTYWPDFDEQELHRAIIDYQQRQRRYGKTGEQIENEEKA